MQRRNFLKGSMALLGALPLHSALAAESSLSVPMLGTGSAHALSASKALSPIIASPDRIIEMNVCTRPFRQQGPRLELERIGRKNVVHNYGHGGSGWSLSWGSAKLAVEMAQGHARGELAVVGCGAIGLTTAIVAQQAGYKVRIYTKDRAPYVASYNATGSFTPDSRIVTTQYAADFVKSWETMARYSFRRFQSFLGTSGNPIEWRDMYSLSDVPPGSPRQPTPTIEPDYPPFERELLQDITPRSVVVDPHPFPAAYVQRRPALIFNITEYARTLMETFLLNGGEIETFEMSGRQDFAAIDERTIINCTGYGARKILGDDTLIPVRGQTAKLIPQPELDYGFFYSSRRVSVYPRRDGLLVQAQAPGDYNNDSELLDPQESISAVQRIQEIVEQMNFSKTV